MDNTNINWPYGRQSLNDFLDHLNSLSNRIKITIEVEEGNQIPFLDVLISKKRDGSLARRIYRKKTHIDRYLHTNSHHYHSQKIRVINTLVTHAIRVSNKDHLDQELQHLSIVFKKNGYSEK